VFVILAFLSFFERIQNETPARRAETASAPESGRNIARYAPDY
jgi:hypothetical protein